MKLKVVDKTAKVAWFPGPHAPLLALGTAADALDPSFNSTTELEIYDVSLSTHTTKMKRVAGIPVSCR